VRGFPTYVQDGTLTGSKSFTKEVHMSQKSLIITIFILCIGLILMGCPKKTVVKEEPSVKKEEAARSEAKPPAKEPTTKEQFEKSLVAEKSPGIQGQVFESSMLKDIHFNFDKYDIRPEDAVILKENAALLKRFSNVKVQIEGHCDERGTVEYNLALGERRANKTKDYLVSLGISTDRISTISYGKERPLDPSHNEEAWAKNRRAHTIITAK
jgi:peptidoglycan-associated lipoprotein